MSPVWWQQGEQAVGRVSIVFEYPLDSAQAPHLTNITDARQMGTSDVLDHFNDPLLSVPVLAHLHHMPVCDVPSQDAFKCSSVLADKNMAPEFLRIS